MVEFAFWFFAALAMALGFKHAFDVDHVVAVSNVLTRSQRMEKTVGLATSWAAGHMVTAALVSAVVYFLADTVLPQLTSRLEILVPVMLIAIGAIGLAAEFRRFHVHRHGHGEQEHTHFHVHLTKKKHEHGAMAGIGVVHGLASNDELLVVLLVGLAADSWWQVAAGVAFFSLGVVIGMLVYAASIHMVSQRTGADWVPAALTVAFSVASILYAGYLLAGGDGVNLVDRFYPG